MSKFILGGIAAVVLGIAAIGSGGGAAQAQCWSCDDSPSSAAGVGGVPTNIQYHPFGDIGVLMEVTYADGRTSWAVLYY